MQTGQIFMNAQEIMIHEPYIFLEIFQSLVINNFPHQTPLEEFLNSPHGFVES